MSHLTPSPNSSPAPRPGRLAPGRLAPDLGLSERALAERIADLPRAGLPEGLAARCLTFAEGDVGSSHSVVGAEGVGAEGTSRAGLGSLNAGRWRVVWAAAAAVLLVLGVTSMSGSRGQHDPRTMVEGPASLASLEFAVLHVVDDPSVPLFHGLETFDQLAGSVLAVAPASGSRSGR